MYKLKIVLLISLQLLCSCLFYSEEIFHFDFHNDVNLKKTDVKNFLESSSSLNFNLITFDELEALNKYDAIQVYNIVKNKENNIFVDLTGKANGRGAYIKKNINVNI